MPSLASHGIHGALQGTNDALTKLVLSGSSGSGWSLVSLRLVPQALHPDGSELATGGRRGALHCWDLPASALPGAAPSGQPPGDAGAGGAKPCPHGGAGGAQKRQKGAAVGLVDAPPAAADTPTTSGQRRPLGMQGRTHGEATVDGLLFLPGGRLASKSADGRTFVWEYAARRKLAGWKARCSLPISSVTIGDGAWLMGAPEVQVHRAAQQAGWQRAEGRKLFHILVVYMADRGAVAQECTAQCKLIGWNVGVM